MENEANRRITTREIAARDRTRRMFHRKKTKLLSERPNNIEPVARTVSQRRFTVKYSVQLSSPAGNVRKSLINDATDLAIKRKKKKRERGENLQEYYRGILHRDVIPDSSRRDIIARYKSKCGRRFFATEFYYIKKR